MRRLALASCLALALAGCSRKPPPGPPEHQIRVVGSNATFPFMTASAERYTRGNSRSIAPLVRAGGTGAGIASFCQGLGYRHPDIVGATRAMTAAETNDCAAHGVRAILSVPIGYGALVLVEARSAAPIALTRAEIYRAMTGHASLWSEVSPTLPPRPVMIAGPTASPMIADGLFDLLLRPGCEAAGGTSCGSIAVRGDGAYRGYGANATLVLQAIAEKPGTIGLVPWAAATSHDSAVRLVPLDGMTPAPATIADGRYPAREPLSLILKAGEAPSVPGMASLFSDVTASWGPGGDWERRGLVPLPAADRARSAALLAPLTHP